MFTGAFERQFSPLLLRGCPTYSDYSPSLVSVGAGLVSPAFPKAPEGSSPVKRSVAGV